MIVGLKKYGKTPTAHLQDLGLLGPDFVAAHGVWLDADDIQRLADHGASVAHNPGSNMLLGNGIAAVRTMLDRKLNVGIGTDGASCCDNQNMYESLARRRLRLECEGTRYRSLAQERGDPPGRDRWQRSRAGLCRQAWQDSQGATRPTWSSSTLPTSTGSPATTRPTSWSTPKTAVLSIPSWSGENAGGEPPTHRRRPLGAGQKAEAARERLAALNAGNKALFERLQGLVNGFCPGLAKTPYHIDHFAGAHHAH